MLYQKRLKRAMDWLHERNKKISKNKSDKKEQENIYDAVGDEGTEKNQATRKSEDEFIMDENDTENENNIPLEKDDRLALILSAFLVFLPFVLIVGVIGAVLIYLITLI